jgi:hypothetical protein
MGVKWKLTQKLNENTPNHRAKGLDLTYILYLDSLL